MKWIDRTRFPLNVSQETFTNLVEKEVKWGTGKSQKSILRQTLINVRVQGRIQHPKKSKFHQNLCFPGNIYKPCRKGGKWGTGKSQNPFSVSLASLQPVWPVWSQSGASLASLQTGSMAISMQFPGKTYGPWIALFFEEKSVPGTFVVFYWIPRIALFFKEKSILGTFSGFLVSRTNLGSVWPVYSQSGQSGASLGSVCRLAPDWLQTGSRLALWWRKDTTSPSWEGQKGTQGWEIS